MSMPFDHFGHTHLRSEDVENEILDSVRKSYVSDIVLERKHGILRKGTLVFPFANFVTEVRKKITTHNYMYFEDELEFVHIDPKDDVFIAKMKTMHNNIVQQLRVQLQ